MSLPAGIFITWPQVFVLLVVALIGALIAELVIGNAPKFGFFGSVLAGLLGAWILTNLPLDLAVEPRLEDLPLIRGILGSFIVVAIFAFFQKQGAFR